MSETITRGDVVKKFENYEDVLCDWSLISFVGGSQMINQARRMWMIANRTDNSKSGPDADTARIVLLIYAYVGNE